VPPDAPPDIPRLTLRQRVNTRLLARLQALLARRGYWIIGNKVIPPDYDPEIVELFRSIEPYTLTSHERVLALRNAVRYLVKADIPGAIVECGVWRGGSMLAIARTLVDLGVTNRDLYLFDTFETMPPPGEHDIDVWGGKVADTFDQALASPGYAYIPQDEIKQLMLATGYPESRLHFVKGMVEDTLPDAAPPSIALCRLDTDWYESTAHELRHLYPRLSPGGVLLIDDYGHLMGCKRAVDEYIEEHDLAVLLHRIDFTGRMVIVPHPNDQHAAQTT
jgi:hypothetical protein